MTVSDSYCATPQEPATLVQKMTVSEVKVDFSFFYEQGTLTKKNELSEDVLQSLLDNDSPALQHPAIKLFLLKVNKFNTGRLKTLEKKTIKFFF